MPVASPHRFLDANNSSEYLGIKKSLFYELLKERDIPDVHIHSKRLWDVKVLDRVADEIIAEQNQGN